MVSVCGHSVVICPNSGDGSPFDCHSFCALCEGFGEFCETCGGKPEGLGEQEMEQAGHVFGELCNGFCPSCSLGEVKA
jgi:hypothetical protein